jgi:hypothetical protein
MKSRRPSNIDADRDMRLVRVSSVPGFATVRLRRAGGDGGPVEVFDASQRCGAAMKVALTAS